MHPTTWLCFLSDYYKWLPYELLDNEGEKVVKMCSIYEIRCVSSSSFEYYDTMMIVASGFIMNNFNS